MSAERNPRPISSRFRRTTRSSMVCRLAVVNNRRLAALGDPGAFFLVEDDDVRFRVEDMRVLAAHFLESLGLLVEVAHRLAAQQREPVGGRELVPEDFETDRRVLL